MKQFLLMILCVVTFWGLTPETLFAQTNIGGLNTGSNITLRPAFPEANQNVTAELNAYGLDTNGATIRWYLDGIEQTTFTNLRQLEFQSKQLGERTNIRVTLQLQNGQTLSLTESVTPSRVDLIVEADTLVPLQYSGRALPSVGSTMRVTAIPITNQNPDTLTYNWLIDNKPIYRGAVVGQNVATFIAPRNRTVLIEVSIKDQSGRTVAKKLKEVNLTAPKLIFYELNPLRGLSLNAITSPYLLIGEEIAVRAEPYYMDKQIFTQNPLMEWKINGRSLENPSEDPLEITLRSNGGTGRFTVDFHIRNLQNYLQGVEDKFVIGF